VGYLFPYTTSLDNHLNEDDFATSEHELTEGRVGSFFLLKTLTEDEQWVASLLSQGFGRIEIAQALGVSLLTIHKIVNQIKFRLGEQYEQRITKRERNLYQNIIFLIVLSNPYITILQLDSAWKSHPVLKDYKKPEKFLIAEWYNLIVESYKRNGGEYKMADDDNKPMTDESTPAEGEDSEGSTDDGDKTPEESGGTDQVS